MTTRTPTYRDALGLDTCLDFHSFRRSYVTHLIEDGWDARFVQDQADRDLLPFLKGQVSAGNRVFWVRVHPTSVTKQHEQATPPRNTKSRIDTVPQTEERC